MGCHNDNMRVIESKIVHWCAPTLAGLKPASMFSMHFLENDACDTCENECCSMMRRNQFMRALHEVGNCLETCGVHVLALAIRPTNALLFVWRPALVEQAIARSRTATYLEAAGYNVNDAGACVAELARRVCAADAADAPMRAVFPHEIGFFLGYPHDDVVAFIEHRGFGGQSVGCWKSYGCTTDARKRSQAYKRCISAFEQMHRDGVSLDRLATLRDSQVVVAHASADAALDLSGSRSRRVRHWGAVPIAGVRKLASCVKRRKSAWHGRRGSGGGPTQVKAAIQPLAM